MLGIFITLIEYSLTYKIIENNEYSLEDLNFNWLDRSDFNDCDLDKSQNTWINQVKFLVCYDLFSGGLSKNLYEIQIVDWKYKSERKI